MYNIIYVLLMQTLIIITRGNVLLKLIQWYSLSQWSYVVITLLNHECTVKQFKGQHAPHMFPRKVMSFKDFNGFVFCIKTFVMDQNSQKQVLVHTILFILLNIQVIMSCSIEKTIRKRKDLEKCGKNSTSRKLSIYTYQENIYPFSFLYNVGICKRMSGIDMIFLIFRSRDWLNRENMFILDMYFIYVSLFG